MEILAHEPSEILFGGAIRRTIVVGKVKVRDAVVKRITDDLALGRERPVVAEVVPEAQRDRRQLQTRVPHTAIAEMAIAIGSGSIWFVREGKAVVHRGDPESCPPLVATTAAQTRSAAPRLATSYTQA